MSGDDALNEAHLNWREELTKSHVRHTHKIGILAQQQQDPTND